jgi:hypothetical protein
MDACFAIWSLRRRLQQPVFPVWRPALCAT